MYRTKTHTHTPHRPLLLCQAFVVRMLGWREHAIREKHATQYQGRRIVVSDAVDEAAAAAKGELAIALGVMLDALLAEVGGQV